MELQLTAEQIAEQDGLCNRVAMALMECEHAAEAVSALLSVTAAYLRTAPIEHRLEITRSATQALTQRVMESLG